MITHYTKRFFPVLMMVTIGFSSRVSIAESPDDIVVIVNKNNKVNRMSIDDVKQIFLGMRESWPNGTRIVCITPKSDTPVRKAFRKTVLGMSDREELTYWEEQRIRRQIRPPAEMSSIAKAVFKLKRAISFAYRKDVPKNVVKIVLVIPAR